MYSFGAMLSFTIAHAAVVALRCRGPGRGDRLPRRGRTSASAASTGRCSRSSAAWAPRIAWVVVVVQDAETRWAGLGWLAIGLRRLLRSTGAGSCTIPLTETVRAPAIVLGPRGRRSGRSSCRCCARPESEEALVAAARLASERGARIALVNVIEVPLDHPLDADLVEEEAEAGRVLDEAQALLEGYGVRTVTRVVRARGAGPAIVEDAVRPRRGADRRRRASHPHASRQAHLRPNGRLRAEAQSDTRPRRRLEAGRVMTRWLSILLIVLGWPCSSGPWSRESAAGSASCSAHSSFSPALCACTWEPSVDLRCLRADPRADEDRADRRGGARTALRLAEEQALRSSPST